MQIANAQLYEWVISVDPTNAGQTVGEPKPCMPGQLAWAIQHGYRQCTAEEKAAAIAEASGEPPPVVDHEPPPPAAAPVVPETSGVKTTVNKAATSRRSTAKPAADPAED